MISSSSLQIFIICLISFAKFREQTAKSIKLIIIFEGINTFQENCIENQISFWLPKYFPEKIRVLITCQSDSETHYYFKKMGCPIISLQNNTNVKEILNNNSNSEEFPYDNMKEKLLTLNNPLIIELFYEYFIKRQILIDFQETMLSF